MTHTAYVVVVIVALVSFLAGMIFWSLRCPFGDTALGHEADEQRRRAHKAEAKLKRVAEALSRPTKETE